jgi:hypothetical protein
MNEFPVVQNLRCEKVDYSQLIEKVGIAAVDR